MKSQVVVATPLGMTEQNTHSDNLEAVAMASALVIMVILGIVVWVCWRAYLKKRPTKSMDHTDYPDLL